MGCRCLPEANDRIKLWQNTIYLFHTYRSSQSKGFSGPFFQAGLSEYLIEAEFPFHDGIEIRVPDIIASGPSGWVCIELTGKTESKESQLSDYKQLDPRYVSSIHGLPEQSSIPDVLSSRLDPFHDGDFCQIAVRNKLLVQNAEKIQNLELRRCLLSAQKADFSRLPSIPISLVPESKHLEIRKGVVDILMLLFDEKCEGLTSEEIARKALDKLEKRTPDKKIKELAKKIEKELDIAVNEHLKGYLVHTKNRYNAGKKFWKYPASRQKITKLLIEWSTEPQAKLDNWWKKGSSNSHSAARKVE